MGKSFGGRRGGGSRGRFGGNSGKKSGRFGGRSGGFGGRQPGVLGYGKRSGDAHRIRSLTTYDCLPIPTFRT